MADKFLEKGNELEINVCKYLIFTYAYQSIYIHIYLFIHAETKERVTCCAFCAFFLFFLNFIWPDVRQMSARLGVSVQDSRCAATLHASAG